MVKEPEIADNDDLSLSTQDWIDAARKMLISEGIAAVKIDRLAKACDVTRGGFYWRFRNRDDLHEQLIDHWRATNGAAFHAAVSSPGTPQQRYKTLIDMWIDETRFDPQFDNAVRAWAASSEWVADAVHQMDEERIAALTELFKDGGYQPEESFIRARIAYFQQIGYYTLRIRESREERESYSDLYYRIITGFGE